MQNWQGLNVRYIKLFVTNEKSEKKNEICEIKCRIFLGLFNSLKSSKLCKFKSVSSFPHISSKKL